MLESDEEKESGLYAPKEKCLVELVEIYGYCYGLKEDLVTRNGFFKQDSPSSVNAPLVQNNRFARFNSNEDTLLVGSQHRLIRPPVVRAGQPPAQNMEKPRLNIIAGLSRTAE